MEEAEKQQQQKDRANFLFKQICFFPLMIPSFGVFFIAAETYYSFWSIVLGAAIVLASYCALRMERVGLACHLFCLSNFLSPAVAALLAGGMSAPPLIWMLPQLLLSRTLLSRRSTFVNATCTCIFFIVLSFVEVSELDEFAAKPDFFRAYFAGAMCTGVAFTCYLCEMLNVEILQEQKTRIAAEGTCRDKQMLLAHMSHELRTPIHGIVMAASIIESAPTSAHKEMTTAISECSNMLLKLIDNILDHAKLERGAMMVNEASFDLSSLLENLLILMRPLASKTSVTIQLKYAHDMPHVFMGDAMRIRQIASNLVGNAIKFSADSEIVIDVAQSALPNEVILQFIDHGKGISEDRQESIFEPFIQENKKITQNFGGTGLGLALVKSLCELMQGTVKVKSELGVGSTFTVTLPLIPTNFPPLVKGHDIPHTPGVSPVVSPILPTPKRLLADKAKKQGPSTRRLKNERKPRNKRNGVQVLLADDVELNRKLMARILKSEGCDVTCVSNGMKAISQVKKRRFDLVIMDMEMPIMGGMQATQCIREELGDRKMLIVAFSGHMQSHIEKAKTLDRNGQPGPAPKELLDGYLDKPLNRTKLLQWLNAAKSLKRKRLREEKASKTSSSGHPLMDALAAGSADEGTNDRIDEIVIRDLPELLLSDPGTMDDMSSSSIQKSTSREVEVGQGYLNVPPV